MSIPITCAGCKSAFDVPDTLAGKTIRCTSCKAQMSVPETLDAVEVVETAAAAPAKKPFGFGSGEKALPKPAMSLDDDTPTPKKAAPPKPAPAPVAKKPAPKAAVAELDEDEEDEKPKAKTKPAKAAAPAPAKKGGVTGSPRKRRDDDDDDDDDDKPARKKQKGGGGGAMIAIIAVGALGLAALAGGGIWYFTKSEDKPAETAANTNNANTTPNPAKPGGGGPENPGGNPNPGNPMGGIGGAGAVPGDPDPGMNPMPPGPGGMNPMPGGGQGGNPFANLEQNLAKLGAWGEWTGKFPGDGFTADFPGKPLTIIEMVEGMPMTITGVANAPAKAAVVVMHFQLPPDAAAIDEKAALNVIVAEMMKSKEFKNKVATDKTLDGRPAKEIDLSDSEGDGRMRIVVVKGRVYMFAAGSGRQAGKPPLLIDAMIERIFVSVKITYKGGDQVAVGPGMPPFVPPGMGDTNPGMPPIGPGMPPIGPGMPPIGPGMPPIGPNPGMPPVGPGDPSTNSDGNLKIKLEPFYAAAFDTEKKEVYTVDARPVGPRTYGYLRRYSYPDFKTLNRFKLPQLGVRATIDSKHALLYVATVTTPGLVHAQAQMDNATASGEIAVYDLKAIQDKKVEEGAELKPVAVVGLKQTIHALELSADLKHLYVLVTTGGAGPKKSQLVVIDTATNKEVMPAGKRKELPELVRDMCKAGDGKNLMIIEEYTPKSKTPGVYVFDTAAMSVLSPTVFSGGVMDFAPLAAGGGIVSVLPVNQPPAGGIGGGQPGNPGGGIGAGPPDMGMGQPGGGAPPMNNFKLFLIDSKGSTEMDLGVAARTSNGGYVEYDPDNKRLFASSWRGPGLDVYEVTDAGAANGMKLKSTIRTARGNPITGHFYMTPDGKALIFHNGVVIDTDNVGGGTPGAGNAGGVFPGVPGMPPNGMPPGGVVPAMPPGGIVPPGMPPGGVAPPGTLPGGYVPPGAPGTPPMPGMPPGPKPPGGYVPPGTPDTLPGATPIK